EIERIERETENIRIHHSKDINQLKLKINNKRREKEHDIILQRQKLTEVVSKLQAESFQLREKTMEKFIEDFAIAHRNDSIIAENQKIKDKLKRNREINIHRIKKMEDDMKVEEERYAEDLKARFEIEKTYKEYVAVEEDKNMQRIKRNIEFREFHKDQQKQRQSMIAEQQQKKHCDEIKEIQDRDYENDRFQEYALKLADEMDNTGKDKRPILSVIRRDRKEVPPKLLELEFAEDQVGTLKATNSNNMNHKGMIRIANTWERLGFSTITSHDRRI
ncbi:hypothetical protein HK096_009156, partial [Nowakowskiella sp. JEL0078]